MKALITGIYGQDGAYLAQHLLELGREVVGVTRPSQTPDRAWRLSELGIRGDVEVLEYDICEIPQRLVDRCEWVFNLAAQSHVGKSFSCPDETFRVNFEGTKHILNCVHNSGSRLYQASSSEMFGNAAPPQSERTPFQPVSPYGAAKLSAHTLCQVYREAFDVQVSCGILFNHESPLRGSDFVTKKIVRELVRNGKVTLGDLSTKRDWGHARDYVKAMPKMMEWIPDDYVIATGESHSVGEFFGRICEKLDLECTTEPFISEELDWHRYKRHLSKSLDLIRPAEIFELSGDASKAREQLKWEPETSFDQLIEEMIEHELSKQRSV